MPPCAQTLRQSWWRNSLLLQGTTRKSFGLNDVSKLCEIIKFSLAYLDVDELLCFSGLRFDLLKEFLLADEMRFSCNTIVDPMHPSNFQVGLLVFLGEGWRSKELSNRVLAVYMYRNLGVLHVLMSTVPCNLSLSETRKNRQKKDDVYVEMPLLDLEAKYNATESGRFLSRWMVYSWQTVLCSDV